MRKKFFAPLRMIWIIACTAAFTQAAVAAELVVRDCVGIRAAKDVEASSLNIVQLNLGGSGSVDGKEIVLNRSDMDTKKVAFIKNGAAVFDDVTPGTWTMCDSSGVLSVASVNIASGDDGAGITAASLIGGSVAAGALAAGLTNDSGGTSNRTQEGSLLVSNSGPVDSTQPVASKPEASAASGRPASARPRPLDDEECRTDEEPDEISPFS